MSRFNFHKSPQGLQVRVGVVALAALAIVSAYLISAPAKADPAPAPAAPVAAAAAPAAVPAAAAPAAAAPAAASAENSALPNIKPGNPVVAKVDGKDINRLDVLNFIQTLSPQDRQAPIDKLFPAALEQVINTQIVMAKTKDVKLDSDPEVKKQVDAAKDQIERTIYLQREVDKQITDQKLKDAYAEYIKSFPDVQEVKASHILVKDEAAAKDLIKKLEGGADFAQLAKDNSTDGTAKAGGELGYFGEKEVVPEFAKAAFDTPVGTYTKTPVKTQFGYHVIKVEDKRKRPPADFETAKPFIQVQLRRQVLQGMVDDWRKGSKIETFDINGDKIEPGAGDAAKPAAPAAAAKPAK